MYQKTKKIIAGVLVVMLMMSHISIIGEVLASSIENQTNTTNQTNVEFDAYFDASKKHEATKNIGEENYLIAEITVKNAGYLKNAVAEINDANFEVVEIQNEQISKTEANKVYFNQIKNGETKVINIPIKMLSKEYISLDEISKISKVKLNAIYVDGNGKEKDVEKEIEVKLTWGSKDEELELNVQIAKFVPYQIKDNKGLVLQTLIRSNIKDNSMPVKTNRIEMEIPKINGIEPEEVTVTSNTTAATNGDSAGVNFDEKNYKVENGKLTIIVENEKNEQEQIAWLKNAIDEFAVTYKYSEEALNSITEDGVKVLVKASNNIETYNLESNIVEKQVEGEVTLKDQISNLVDFDVVTSVDSISKGQMYANYNTKNKIETEYKEVVTANIGFAELTDKILIEQNQDKFVIDENTKANIEESYIKEIKISKEEFDKIFGEEGTISIYAGEAKIAEINNESEDKDFTINVAELNINTLKIETSKPSSDGKLNIILTKAIKGETEFSKNQIKNFVKIETGINGKAENESQIFVEQLPTKEITLIEPTTQAELIVNKTNLSTMVVNKDVKITAILRTDTLDCSLYQNPTVKITLPSYIENIDIKNAELLFETEGSKLNIKSAEMNINSDNTKTITINLEGTQTEYTLGAISKGINIVINADLTLNKLTPNKQDQITMVCTNNNVVNNNAELPRVLKSVGSSVINGNQEIVTVGAPINTVAPVGVVTVSEVSNYKDNAETIEAMGEEDKTAIIGTLINEKVANFKMNVVNNFNNTIDNVSILGRLMFKSNKDILTNTDMGSTFTTMLQGPITVTGVEASKYTVYYSENGDATKDVTLSSNGWTATPTNYENIKSYLIVLANNYEMQTGSNIEFSYNAKIPAGLQHNESAFEQYVVYFNNNLATGAVEANQKSAKLCMSTGTGPIIEAGIKANTDKELQKGDKITYTITVKNTGTEAAQNVVANITIPEGLQCVEPSTETNSGYKVVATSGDYKVAMGNVAPNQTVTKEVIMEATDVVLRPIVNATLTRPANEGNDFVTGDRLNYTLTVRNEGTGTAQNVKVNITIPKWLKYINETTGEAIANAGEYTIEIGTLRPTENVEKNLVMQVVMDRKISVEEDEELTEEEEAALIEYEHTHGHSEENDEEIDEDLYKVLTINSIAKETIQNEKNTNIEVKAQISADNIDGSFETTGITTTIGKTSFNTSLQVQKENSVVKEGESFKYVFNILADSYSSTIENTILSIALPKEIEYESVEIKDSKNNQETDITKNVQVNYDNSARKLKINLGTVDGITTKAVYLNVRAGKLENNVYDTKVVLGAAVAGTDVNSRNIEVEEVEIGKLGLKVTQSSNDIPENATISTGEDFKYTFTIENLSNIDIPEVTITDILPKELNFGSIIVTDSEGNKQTSYNKNSDGNPEVTIMVPALKTVTVSISVTALDVGQTTKITNQAKITADGMEDILTNTISHTLQKFELYTEETEHGGNIPSTQGNKRIAGIVWIDENGNGARDEKEEVVKDVDVLLFNNNTGTLVTDSKGNVLRAKTEKDGIYTFSRIAQGSYTVIFLYDTANYGATTYKAKGVDEEKNSDAIDSKITLDGIARVAAITEAVIVSNNSLYDIDLGLISNPKFDLKLDKTISKITVQDSTGTNVYEFNNTKLAKKELVGKNISSSTIIVEYKLKVTNEGAIAGYVKRLADYMPSEMRFNSELNPDWYSAENGVLYNASLANIQINPGESKEVTLILTKKMTDNNLGLYHNEAEIYEAYNDLGLDDIDSKPGNKASIEDDFSNADVLISVKTGEVALFIGLSISIIATIAISAYVIKKKVIR